MKRFFTLFILTAMLASATACSEKKAPEQISARSKSALSVLHDMTHAYETKDLNAFMTNVSGSYRDRDAFSKALGLVFAKYTTIRFTIHYTKILIMIEDRGLIKPTFTWDAEWIAPDGATMKDGGRITLGFEQGSVKLLTIEGRNPFLAQPGETPGGAKL